MKKMTMLLLTVGALSIAACDKLSHAVASRASNNQGNIPSASVAGNSQLINISEYAGQDMDAIGNKLDQLLKPSFIETFGKQNWDTWASFFGDGVVKRINDRQLGDLLLLPRAQLAGSGLANTGRFAVVLVRTDGSLQGVCFGDNGDESDSVSTIWYGHGWRAKTGNDECKTDMAPAALVAEFKQHQTVSP